MKADNYSQGSKFNYFPSSKFYFFHYLLLFNIDNIFFLIENLYRKVFIKRKINCVNYFKDFNPKFVLNIALKIIREKWVYNNCNRNMLIN